MGGRHLNTLTRHGRGCSRGLCGSGCKPSPVHRTNNQRKSQLPCNMQTQPNNELEFLDRRIGYEFK